MQNFNQRQCPECENTITLVAIDETTHRGCTVCGSCGAFLAFTLDGKLRLMTEEEILELPDQARIEMNAMRRHIQRNGHMTGPQISDDRLALIVDGAEMQTHEPRMIAAELLARRSKDLGPLKCPNCDSPNVSVTITDHPFYYGAEPNTVQLVAHDVEVLWCSECDQAFTGLQAEQKRSLAVIEHLASNRTEVRK